ncbi:hypothetical protein ACHAWO_004029 [Cyclotella atomus]|uniref:Uncharacterized protein n=1 Tax=Cyclotella atomus TaxID=382360 RepID=A0ABD3MYQ1_9STRA
MMAQSYTESTLTPTSQPYVLYAITSRPPGSTKGSTAGGNRDPIQVICPYTGSNLTSAHTLRVPVASSIFGVRCLQPVPTSQMMSGGGDDANNTIFVGHGGGTGNKDDHAFLLSNNKNGNTGNSNPKWKVRLPEVVSNTPQSMTVSSCGRYLVAGCSSGNCYLWSWTSEDNLLRVWKAHYRPVTCCIFDEDGMLFTGGEDGVVNAWSLLDLVDEEQKKQMHPYLTWSAHHLPVSNICVLKGSGVGCTRLVSCSLDRHLIVMEVRAGEGGGKSVDGSSGARTLARMCLPSGLHCVISDSLSGRLYAAGADGSIYCVNMDKYAIHETLDGATGGTTVHVNQVNRGIVADFGSIMAGNHVMQQSSTPALIDQTKYVSELNGHVKAVSSLALLDPADLALTPTSTKSTCMLASGSNDGTVRIWDLSSRSCVKVLRPWAPSSEGLSITSAASTASSPPITSLIAVPKSSLSSVSGSFTITFGSQPGKCSGSSLDITSVFKPLKRFVRGSSALNDKDAKDQQNDCYVMILPQLKRAKT